MEFVVDWNAVCLVCLQEGEMRSLHEKDSIGILLSEKITKCTNIEICGKNFPEHICIVCEADLEAAYRFKTNVENSNAILNSLLETQTNTKYTSPTEKTNVEQPIFITKDKPDDIKREEIQNDENIESSNEHDKKYEKLIKENIHTHGSGPIGVYNDETVMPPQNLLETTVKRIGRKTDNINPSYERINKNHFVAEFRDKKIIGDIVKVTIKPKNSNKPLKICEICGNSYKYQNALESHMRRHRNEKPFSCEFCQRSFVANVELRRHMRVHTGQKPYTCNFCPRAFSDFGSRRKHERTHTGERPYACETCGKTFAYAHVLQVHILTHTGEKKYKCSICGKGFTKKSYLISHTNNNHRLNQY